MSGFWRLPGGRRLESQALAANLALTGAAVSTISTLWLTAAVLASMAEAEQYFSAESCTAPLDLGAVQPGLAKLGWQGRAAGATNNRPRCP